MPILQDDIKIYKSDSMTDLDQGGGQITGQLVTSNQSNNIFNDISTLNRVYGAVHMRKVYGLIHTQTTDIGYGSHVILSKIPKDEKIGITLFNTSNWFDRRTDAVDRVENYLGQSVRKTSALWGNHFKGSSIVSMYQSATEDISGVGDVIVLSDVSNGNAQFLRIVNVSTQLREFTDVSGLYSRIIVTCELSEPLLYDFEGADINRLDIDGVSTVIYTTIVIDAGRYYGSHKIVKDLASGDSTMKVDSVYNQLVPSAQSELAILDVTPSGVTSLVVQSSDSDYSLASFSVSSSQSGVFYLPSPVTPNTLSISNLYNYVDNGLGDIVDPNNGEKFLSIDYKTGAVTIFKQLYGTNFTNISYKPAGNPQKLADSFSIPITDGNRGFVYVVNLNPIPSPETTIVSYLAGGSWIDLKDDGTGNLTSSDPSLGQANINFITGSMSMTLGFLPDTDSEIIITYGTTAQYIDRSDHADERFVIKHALANTGAQPDSLVMTWNDGTPKTATCNLAGQIGGDGVGFLDMRDGIVHLYPDDVPTKGTVISYDYDSGAVITETHSIFATAGDNHAFTAAGTNLTAGSVLIKGSLTTSVIVNTLTGVTSGETIDFVIKDDGLGGWVSLTGDVVAGSIDYVTGDIVFHNLVFKTNFFTPTFEKNTRQQISFNGDSEPVYGNVKEPVVSGMTEQTISAVIDTITLEYRTVAANGQPTEIETINSIEIDITTGSNESIVPNSLIAEYMNLKYYDRSGSLYHTIDPETNAGILAGTINYDSGLVNITNWTGGLPNIGDVLSLLIDSSLAPVYQVSFRVKQIPIKVGSFTIRAIPLAGGGEISVTADASGIIRGAGFDGHINYETGVVKVNFATLVVADGNELEPWFDATQIRVDGNILRPEPVLPSSIVYNAVSIVKLPLSSEILGLSPVRLPVDGRVPVYNKGDVVVILNEKETVGTHSNNAVVDVLRTGLSKLTVVDSGGNYLLSNLYSANLDTGIVTFGDLTGVSQPITITDRVEDMAVVSDVQVNGVVTISSQLSNAYPVEGTLVCNAVVYNDLFASVTPAFDQQTWTNEWHDSVIGNTVLAEYNDSQNPIQVTNASAVTEQWLILFTTSSDFQIIGKEVGVIATGDILNDSAPLNPSTGDPYFTLLSAGWGVGWSAGNVLRFDTTGAGLPLWIIQAVSQGEPTSDDYKFCLEVRMDRESI